MVSRSLRIKKIKWIAPLKLIPFLSGCTLFIAVVIAWPLSYFHTGQLDFIAQYIGKSTQSIHAHKPLDQRPADEISLSEGRLISYKGILSFTIRPTHPSRPVIPDDPDGPDWQVVRTNNHWYHDEFKWTWWPIYGQEHIGHGFRGPGAEISSWDFAGLSYEQTYRAGPPSHAVKIPWAYFLIFAALLITPKTRQVIRTQRRLRRNLCLGCGYDMRASASPTCPECGSDKTA